IAAPEFVAALEKVRQPFNINSLVQAGAIAALDDEEHIRRTRANNAQGRQFLERELSHMRLQVVPSAPNFVLVKVGDPARVLAELQKQGVITRPMGGYQLPEWI